MICSPVSGSRWTSRVGILLGEAPDRRRRLLLVALALRLVGECHHRRRQVELAEVDGRLLLRQHVAGTGLAQLRDRADVARAELVDRPHVLALGHRELADPLLLAPGHVERVRVGGKHAGVHAQHVDPPGVGVGGRLEREGEQLAGLVRLDLDRLIVGAERGDRAVQGGRRQVLHERLEQPVGAEVAGRDPAGDREQVALGDPLLERRDDLVVGDLLALEVAFHQRVGVLGDLIHQLLAVLLGLRNELVGDVDLLCVASPVAGVLERGHVDQVDDPADLVLRADRDLGRDHVLAERRLQALQAAEEVGALAVEHVHEHEPSEALLVGTAPEAIGLHLDPHHRVDDEHRRVDDPQRGERVGDEARLAGRVDHVHLAPVVLERGHRGPDRHPAGLLVGLEVADGRAVGHRAEPVDDPGLEQDRLGEARLATATMADEGHVANPIRGLVGHSRNISLRRRRGGSNP